MPPRVSTTIPTSFVPRPSTLCQSCLRRTFSSTPQVQKRIMPQTKLRRTMWSWLNTAGKNFEQPPEDLPTNYLTSYNKKEKYAVRRVGQTRRSSDPEGDSNAGLSSRPFPMNDEFQSQSILSEELRLEVWKRVQVDKQSVRQVSAELGITMERVGAVVRLVELEKKMRAEKKELAIPYAEAIHKMVPITDYISGRPQDPHETINDLPHHSLTAQQLFYPTSESRAFNRTDAGRVFSAAPRLPDEQDIGQGGTPAAEPWANSRTEIIGKIGNEMPVLKPADARIPHPHLIKYEQEKFAASNDPSIRPYVVQQRYVDRLKEDQTARKEMFAAREARSEERKTRINKGKWEFVFTDVQAESGVGIKYGVPSQDRKRGNVKIPTRVEV